MDKINPKLRYITVFLLLLLELSLSPLSQGNQHSRWTKFLVSDLTLMYLVESLNKVPIPGAVWMTLCKCIQGFVLMLTEIRLGSERRIKTAFSILSLQNKTPKLCKREICREMPVSTAKKQPLSCHWCLQRKAFSILITLKSKITCILCPWNGGTGAHKWFQQHKTWMTEGTA